MNKVKNNKIMVIWLRGAIAHGSLHIPLSIVQKKFDSKFNYLISFMIQG